MQGYIYIYIYVMIIHDMLHSCLLGLLHPALTFPKTLFVFIPNNHFWEQPFTLNWLNHIEL